MKTHCILIVFAFFLFSCGEKNPAVGETKVRVLNADSLSDRRWAKDILDMEKADGQRLLDSLKKVDSLRE